MIGFLIVYCLIVIYVACRVLYDYKSILNDQIPMKYPYLRKVINSKPRRRVLLLLTIMGGVIFSLFFFITIPLALYLAMKKKDKRPTSTALRLVIEQYSQDVANYGGLLPVIRMMEEDNILTTDELFKLLNIVHETHMSFGVGMGSLEEILIRANLPHSEETILKIWYAVADMLEFEGD